jgi:hypothetical protein
MTAIHEIAPDVFRLSLYVPDLDMQFNHFLARDEEPLLFHTGLKGMFPALREAVGKLIDPANCAPSRGVTLSPTNAARSTSGCNWLRRPGPSAPSLASW